MKYLVLSLIFLFQGACASKFFIPGNHFLSPESGGKFMHGDVKNGVAGATTVQLADDITLASPDTTPKLEKNSSGFIGAQLGLVDHIDVYASEASSGPVFAGGKIQILGDSFREAKAGNFSFSIAGGSASGTLTKSVDSNNIKSEAKITFGGWEALVLIGYRATDWTLFYLSPFVTHITAKGLTQQTPDNVIPPVTTVTSQTEGEGDTKGGTLGLRFGKYFFVSGEVSYTETTWKEKTPTVYTAPKFTNTAVGVVIGGAW